jgi:hypothetical protein
MRLGPIEEDLTLAVKVDEEVMSTFHYKDRVGLHHGISYPLLTPVSYDYQKATYSCHLLPKCSASPPPSELLLFCRPSLWPITCSQVAMLSFQTL